jgi:hypothetical protein
MLYYFARELQYRGFYGGNNHSSGSKKFLLKAGMNQHLWIKERGSAYCLLAESFEKTDLESRRKWYLKSIETFPCWREPYLKCAEVEYDAKNYFLCYCMAKMSLLYSQIGSTNKFAEPAQNETTEPYRLMYIGASRHANVVMMTGENPLPTLALAEEVENLHGCGAPVNIYGWHIGFLYNKQQGNKEETKKYLKKCYEFDANRYLSEYINYFM